VASRSELSIPILLALAMGGTAVAAGPRIYDDAYITLRYAANLASGAGLVYNPGERVLGTSAPAYAVLVAGIARAGGGRDLARISYLLGLLCVPLVIAVGYKLLRRVAPPLVAGAALLAALAAGDSLEAFSSGMETPLYLLGIVAALELAAGRRYRSAFLVAGLLPFLHPEAALLAAAILVAVRLAEGRWPWAEALPAAIPALAVALALGLYYGSPIPHSIAAKLRVYSPAPFVAAEGVSRTLVETVLPADALDLVADDLDLLVDSEDFSHLAVHLTEAMAAILAPLAAGALLWRARPWSGQLVLTAAGLFAVGYGLFFAAGNPQIFVWYWPPLRLTAAIALAAALGHLLPRAGGRLRRTAAVWLAVAAAGAAVRMTALRPYDTSEREEVYRRAVQALALTPADLVAAPEIGAIGYFSPARVFDTAGLVSPAALSFYDAAWRSRLARTHGSGFVPARLIPAIRPDYVIALDHFLELTLVADPHALDGYDQVAFYPASRFRSQGVAVYRRRAR
jgi:hypothetical protein